MKTILFIIFIITLNFFLKKKKLLSNNTGQLHQTFSQEFYVPLSGGLFILIFFYFNYQYFDSSLLIYLSSFFILGLLTDLNFIKSPTYRFLFQIFLLLFFIINQEISIYDVRIFWINNLLNNYYFNVFFVLFCFLVLINGTNFVDGNNGITLGYFCIIFTILINLIDQNLIFYEENFLIPFLVMLIILLIFNLNNQFFLGDSGVYLLSLFTGYILINIYSQNEYLSPYFIVNIFWYPAFEILFSLIRKLKSKYSPLMPDTLHFHQLLFFYYSNKISVNKNFLNSLTGLSINIFNGIILYFASLNFSNTKIQILFLLFSLMVYLVFYFIFLNFKKKLI